jgi:large subunit ribosomal protein L25
MVDTLKVDRRTDTGKRRMKRLRRAGSIPAMLYGHGEENVALAVPSDQITAAIRHGSKLVDLTGAVSESALIRDVQWSTYGTEILHVDLARVSKTELVKVTVSIEIRGDAAGTREGGVVQHQLHQVQIECPAVSIPDHLVVNVNHLELGKVIHASDLQLPEGARLLSNPEAVVVQCVLPRVVEEAPAVPTGEGAEPELIGRKPEEEEGEEE